MLVPCPTCRRKTRFEDNPYRPFCSERCKLADLGRWAAEEYRIPVTDSDEDEDGTATPEEGREGA